MLMHKEYDPWTKDNAIKLDRSEIGDELIVSQKAEDGRNRILTYLCSAKHTFFRAKVMADENGVQTISRGSEDKNTDEVLGEINAFNAKTGTKMYWNRRKFKSYEIDMIHAGTPMNNYREITMEYSPMKALADKKIAIANNLDCMKPGTEIEYQKYIKKNRGSSENLFYICTGPKQFVRAIKTSLGKDEESKSLYVSVIPGVLSTEDVMKEFPKEVSEMAPDNSIPLAVKEHKYTEWAIRKMVGKHQMMNDSEFERQRLMWLKSDKFYSQIIGVPQQNVFIEHWKDTRNNKILKNIIVELEPEQIKALAEQKKIFDRKVEVSLYYQDDDKERGFYRELWKEKETGRTIRNKAVILSPEKAHQLQNAGRFLGVNVEEKRGVKIYRHSPSQGRGPQR